MRVNSLDPAVQPIGVTSIGGLGAEEQGELAGAEPTGAGAEGDHGVAGAPAAGEVIAG